MARERGREEMPDAFKPEDAFLEQLVTARREEVVRLQKAQADHLADLQKRGQARSAELKKTLPKDLLTVVDGLDKAHEKASAQTKANVKKIKERLAASTPGAEGETPMHPGLANGHLIAPSSLGWFSPYYGVLHWSDGSVSWQGYNPGNFDLWDSASGAGNGWFGSGAGSFTGYVDWWFTYRPTENRNYAHTIWVPFHGFYIVYSDDGFWDSKEAHVRMDLSAVGYQYNYKATSSTNVFDLDSQNINVNDRFDGWRTMYYSDLLGSDRAYLRVTASFYVYARGGGSFAELNFNDGSANYVGVPWVYIN
jgi:hypothetical protein